MTRKPVVTRTEIIAHTRFFQVERIGLRFTNGREVIWERLRSPARGAVLVVPLLDPETVLLIREYAAGVERYELALPKGRIEDNESVTDAGQPRDDGGDRLRRAQDHAAQVGDARARLL